MTEKKFVNDSEAFLSTDKFGKPLLATGIDMASVLILRLILLEPGTFQTHPDMGVGLVSRFRYSTDIDMQALSNEITTQISKYLPQYITSEVKCKLDPVTKVVNIYITSDEINAMFPIDTETGNLVEKTTNLSAFN